MIKIPFNTNDKTFNIMPRALGASSLLITDKETNITTEVTTFTEVDNVSYIALTITNANYAFEDSHRYVLKAYNGSDELLYYGLIYCTSTTTLTNGIFDKHDGKYTPHTTTNEYTIYES